MAAEALGLAFGAVSLASLFQACVQCYEYIDRGKTCGRDLAILMTRLEIEKIRLSMWGESVDVFRASEGMSGVFERPQVRDAVYNVLNCIHMVSLQSRFLQWSDRPKVFTDVQELRSRYGLNPSVEENERPAGSEDLSNIRPVRFQTSLFRFRNPLARGQESSGMLNHMTWAVKDWKKFTLMVDDLLSFNNGLEAITNCTQARERRPRLIETALESLQPDLSNLRLVQEAATGSNDTWAEAANSIIERSEVGTTAGRILGWREDVNAGLAIDNRSEDAPPEVAQGSNGETPTNTITSNANS